MNVPILIDSHTRLPKEMWRLLILFLANGKCQDCGSRFNLQCHHIDGNSHNHILANGYCYCRHCHSDWHKLLNKSNNPDHLIAIALENRINWLNEFSVSFTASILKGRSVD